VPKKDGKWRMCCDCMAINNITINTSTQFPMHNNMLDELHESTDDGGHPSHHPQE